MLIMDQTKQLIVNLDNVLYLYIEKKSLSIKAALMIDGGSAEFSSAQKISLGTYNSLDDCIKVLRDVFNTYYDPDAYTYEMPLGGEVKEL